MNVKVYVSRTNGNKLMTSHQNHIRQTLDAKRIKYQEIDVGDPHFKEEKIFMQTTLKLNDEDLKALPPQIFKDNVHRGDYESFFKAVELEELFGYLDMEAPPDEVEYQRQIQDKQG